MSSSKHLKSLSSKKRGSEHSPVKKKKKTDLPNVKKESLLKASRTLSSSLSSLNSDFKTKAEDQTNKKSKSKLKNNKDYSTASKNSPPPPDFKNGFEEELKRKERKEKRKRDNEESNSSKKKDKKSKTSVPSSCKEEEKNSKKHRDKSGDSNKREQSQEKIIKEKNKDSINKQTSHKEHNLKKEATTSTKISFSNNNSTGLTTLEITSVKNVKMTQSESKKSKQHQDQILNQTDKRSFKTDKAAASNHYASPLIKESNNNNNFDNETPTSSPFYATKTNDKAPTNKQTDDNKRNYEKIMSDMRKKREISPLHDSDDLNSELDFNLDNNGYRSNSEENEKIASYFNEDDRLKRAKQKKLNQSYLEEKYESDEFNKDLENVDDLIELQKQISELKDKEMLSEIVEIVRESGLFKMNGKLFDFDLLKLDKVTIKKVKLCLA